jgi:hypothetical protein
VTKKKQIFLSTQMQAGLEVLIPAQPLDLRPGVAVDNIAFVILEVSGEDNKDVAFPDPDFFLNLALDPAHPGDAIKASDPDVVCAHHEFGAPELFAVSVLGKSDPDDLVIGSRRCRSVIGQKNLSCSSCTVFLHIFLHGKEIRILPGFVPGVVSEPHRRTGFF